MSKINTPDGPLHSTEVDGCVVHGRAPMTDASREAIKKVIAAAKIYSPPGHTDLMVTPESLDAFLDANPLPE